MFATVSTKRSKRRAAEETQRETSPPPGGDSTFGVRSLNGSISWNPISTGSNHSTAPPATSAATVAAQDRRQGGEADDASKGGFGAYSEGSLSEGHSLSTRETSPSPISTAPPNTLDHRRTDGNPYSAMARRGQGDRPGEMDPTPRPSTPPPLPDPFASHPSPIITSTRDQQVRSSKPSSPIAVTGRIAHIGSGILWGPSSPDETLHPLSLSSSGSLAVESGPSQGLASLLSPSTRSPPLRTRSDNPDRLAEVSETELWRDMMFGDRDNDDDNGYIPRSLSNLDGLRDPTNSEPPSSPASFTSLPSYVASLSSMSRTSSPVSGVSGPITYHLSPYADSHKHAQAEQGLGMSSGSQELVLPTLSLPSTSLHLSLRKWDGGDGIIRIALLGSKEEAQGVIRALGERVEMVETGRGVGILRDGKAVLCLAMYETTELIRKHVVESYTELSGLLHPSPPKGSEGQVKGMISEHARRAEWVHLVYELESGADDRARALKDLVPIKSSTLADLVSPIRMNDPTPMPADHPASSYFENPAHSTKQNQSVDALLAMLDDLGSIEEGSSTAFLSYRPNIIKSRGSSPMSLEASMTSADSGPYSGAYSSSSGMDARPIMPTVARASGGGEWEAGLSRRVAAHLQRREREDKKGRRGQGRGQTRGRRRKSEEERSRTRCPPLFPVRPTHSSGGLSDAGWISSSLFGNIRDFWAKWYGWRLHSPRPRINDQLRGDINLPRTLPSHARDDEPEKSDKAASGRGSWRWRLVSVSLAVLAFGVGLWVSSAKIEVKAVVRW